MVIRLFLALFTLTCGCVTAQQTSVKPGINDSFKNPDIDRLTQMFEGESREVFRMKDEIVAQMGLSQGMTVADIGAGTGLFSLPIAEKVGASGSVIAVDISQKLLDHIIQRGAEAKITNIKTQLSSQKKTGLKRNSVDLVFICDTYHHFEFPEAYMKDVYRSLKRGGKLVIVDFRRDPDINEAWVMDHVRLDEEGVINEVAALGFRLEKDIDIMNTQYMLVFSRF